MAETPNTFPSIPISHWINLREQFKKSIPGIVTTNYLASTLGMTESSARKNIVPSLKKIGLIDEEGKTNQDLAKQFRDDAQYAKFCESIWQKVYPQELRDAFPDKNSDRGKIATWFMNHTGVGENGAGKLSGFYMAILEADTSNKKTVKPKEHNSIKPKASKTKPKISKDINEVKETGNTLENGNTFTPPPVRQKGPDLNINIQIHISSDASPDQIKSIFENMSKYLYKDKIDE